ncbi:MAG: hypothetical protein WCI55_17185 [Armatimonadota bacterium]
MNLTGTWEGHYFQNWIQGGSAEMDETSDYAFAIHLEIVENDGQFTGRMRDVRTSWSINMDKALSVSNASWFQKTIVKLFYPMRSVVTIGHELPTNSSIEGKLDGQMVSFKKSYEGASRQLFDAAGRERITLKEPEPVYYFGTLNDDGNLMEGKFVVGNPNDNRPEAQGLFRLRRSR